MLLGSGSYSTPLFPGEIGHTAPKVYMDFGELHRRFVNHLRSRVSSGELTERGLARMTGISQPHVHNVLKGKRNLSVEMADAILYHLELDLIDLFQPDELLEWRRRS